MAFTGDLQFLRRCSLGPCSLVMVGKKEKQSARHRKLTSALPISSPYLAPFPQTESLFKGWNNCRSRRGNRKHFGEIAGLKPRANGRNIVGCYMLRPFALPVACCWMLLRVVAQSLKPVKLFSQQLPTFLLFRDDSNNGATMFGIVASVCTQP